MVQLLDMNGAAKLIRAAREKAGLSQEALAARTELSKTTIQNAESGKSEPTGATKWKVVKALGYREWDDMALALNMREAMGRRTDDPGGGIPVYKSIPMGNGDYEDGGYEQGVAESYLSRTATGVFDPHAYAVHVIGDSMMPTLQEGEVVLCSPSELNEKGFVDGKIYAMRFASEMDSECTIKRVRLIPRNNKEIELIPDNPRHSRQIVATEMIVHAARCVKTLRDL